MTTDTSTETATMTTFLDQPSRFLFFTGKGGVGKTALSCATGSTDPCLVQRVAAELEQIEVVRDRHAQRVAIVPWVTEEPVGPARLLALARGAGPRAG